MGDVVKEALGRVLTDCEAVISTEDEAVLLRLREEYPGLVREWARLRAFAEHVARQDTYLTANPYAAMARAALRPEEHDA
jgi:hypothetical protein